jgi:hypothetical protein
LHPEPEKRIQGFLWVAEAEWKRRDRKTAHRDCVRAARELFRSGEFEGRGALREQSLALLYQVAGSEGLLELAESEGWRDTIVSSLVGILRERGELEEAFTLAESLEDEWPKKNCITDLARAWLDRREVARAMDVVDAAPTIWGTWSSDYNFIDHLTQTLVDLADWGLFQKVAARLSRVDRDISSLTGVIKGAVKAGKLDFARQISCLPGSDEWRGGAILALAYYLAGDGRCDEALEVARSGEGPWRVRAVAMIAAAMEGRTVPPALEAEARAAAEHLDSIADDRHKTDAARYLSCALAPDDPLAVNLARSA